MKSSIGVTLCALVVIAGSALVLAGGVGMAYVFLGPMSREFFDPASLPPGADVNFMRASGLAGALIFSVLGIAGILTGIGLIRLWRWSRYAVIAYSGFVVLTSVLFGVVAIVAPPPSTVTQGPEFERFARMAMLAFDAAWLIGGTGFLFFFLRPKTAEQFNGSGPAVAHATRPLSITIIAWLMIVSGVFMLPWPSFSLNLPAFFLGITFGGLASKLFYLAYMTAYVAVGVGLLRERPVALTAAIVLHALALINSLTMAVPSVWANYQRVIRSMSPMFANEPTRPSVQFFSVGSGIVVGSLILYFLLKAKRK